MSDFNFSVEQWKELVLIWYNEEDWPEWVEKDQGDKLYSYFEKNFGETGNALPPEIAQVESYETVVTKHRSVQ